MVATLSYELKKAENNKGSSYLVTASFSEHSQISW